MSRSGRSFNYGLQRFTPAEFEAVGITAEQQYLLKFMANQEVRVAARAGPPSTPACVRADANLALQVGHATLISNMLGASAPRRCTYNYTGAFDSVPTYVDFNQRLTRWVSLLPRTASDRPPADYIGSYRERAVSTGRSSAYKTLRLCFLLTPLSDAV